MITEIRMPHGYRITEIKTNHEITNHLNKTFRNEFHLAIGNKKSYLKASRKSCKFRVFRDASFCKAANWMQRSFLTISRRISQLRPAAKDSVFVIGFAGPYALPQGTPGVTLIGEGNDWTIIAGDDYAMLFLFGTLL